ncbi:hypothetical protein Jiend_38650 [Micromonospora endophytica]|nr:hypothetical protein Jiend_38650 [Micromonospora endophytica]
MAVSEIPARPGNPPARPARAPRRARGEGQWALGHREPLNPNERTKKDDDPLNVRQRIENIYAHRGFASIDPQDLRGRFRWWGLYTQRKAGIDGGRTAVLEPHELEDEYFMLRVRVDGGQLNLAQLRTIAEISQEFARDTADITDRQNIQYHWIRVEDMPEIWRRLESVGLQTTEACGDCPRIVLGSPVAGVAETELIDPTPAIDEIVRRYVGDKQFSNLPASSSRRSPGWWTPRTRRTTSPFSASTTPSTVRVSTSGSAAVSPPTRCWPSGSASGCRWPRCRTSGPVWSASSATTATAGCAIGPG